MMEDVSQKAITAPGDIRIGSNPPAAYLVTALSNELLAARNALMKSAGEGIDDIVAEEKFDALWQPVQQRIQETTLAMHNQGFLQKGIKEWEKNGRIEIWITYKLPNEKYQMRG